MTMACRRRLQRFRTRNTLLLVCLAIIFLGMFLTYKTVSTPDGQGDLPAKTAVAEKKKPRYHLAHQNFNLFPNLKRIHSSLDKQFNSGLRNSSVMEVLAMLYPATWPLAKEADEMAIILKDRMMDLDLQSPMDCRKILSLRTQGSVGFSSRKFVERLVEGQQGYHYSNNVYSIGVPLAVMKSQGMDVQTKIACMKQIYNADFCSTMGNYLLLREVFLFSYLQHPNLVRLLGYCLRGDHISVEMSRKGVVMVMEVGVPLTPLMLSAMPWSRRLQMALDAASLLEYLQSTPLGSVGLPHVQLKDFVLVDYRTLKLVDLDEAELGERICSAPKDCLLQEVDVGVLCNSGRCQGLNVKVNLKVIGGIIFEPLLKQPPHQEEKQVKELLERLQHLDLFPTELVSILEPLAYAHKQSGEELSDTEGDQQQKDKVRGNAEDRDADEDEGGQEEGEDNRNLPMVKNPRPDLYTRLESSNYPGQFDYPCTDSRVLWGCVMTFDTMMGAMTYCTEDTACKAFVIFSASPERERKLTVVFKRHNSVERHVSLGTTLFIKKGTGFDAASAINNATTASSVSPVDVHPAIVNNEIPVPEAKHGNKSQVPGEEADPWAKVKAIQDCLRRSHENQKEALRSREKRLMAHLGLKGHQERDWKRAARLLKIVGYSHLRAASGERKMGGAMLLHYNNTRRGQAVTYAQFLREDSAEQSHILFALVYFLDRLLGLYHTPPAVDGFLEAAVVNRFRTGSRWSSMFGQLLEPDSTLKGLFVAPSPKVLKTEKLTLQPVTQMVSEVVPFDRLQKMQLEYVLLWWLGYIRIPDNLHQGFKGHMIMVRADRAFQDTTASYEGYFNHCQFPNVIYKLLACFRCSRGEGDKICHLGPEAVRRIEAAGLHLSDLHLHGLSDAEYPTLINRAASRAVEIVDQCIQTFGREAVLY